MDAEVLIVGAGFAGLSAARELQRSGKHVRVIEARERVGGRSLSQRFGSDTLDLGGQWLGPGQRRALALVRELGLETFPQPHRGGKLLEVGGRVRRYEGTIPRIDLPSLLLLQGTIERLERLRLKVPLDAPWEAHPRWDGLTLESWLRRNVPTPNARRLLDIATRAIFAVEPSELSFLHFLFYLNSGGGLMRLASVAGGAQERRVVGGTQQLAEGLAAQLDEPVLFGAPVRSITQDGDGVRVETDRGTLRAERVVVALPPALAGRIHYAPALPARRDQITQRMAMGSAIKVIVRYERAFWRDDGLSGEAVSDHGPLRLVFDDSAHDGSQACLVGFFLGHTALRFSGRPDARRRAAVDTLVRLFGPRARTPIDYVDQDWPAEPFSRGCYVGVLGPGAWTACGQALRAPCGRIHWAGTETAREWCGYFEGALESGERAAREVLAS